MLAKLGKSLLICCVLLGAGVSSLKSDTLNGASPTAWDPNRLFDTPGYVPSLYYWNNYSGDGPQANIGWCLIGSSQCGMQNPPGDLPYYSASGNAPSDMYFTSTGGHNTTTLELTLTSQKGGPNGVDFFGYYLTNANGTVITNPTALFTANNAVGSSIDLPSVPVGDNYGFFIENIQGFGTINQTEYIYYMDSAANTTSGSMPADNLQHFAIFSSDGINYYIGASDPDACQGSYQPGTSPCVPASDFDYNDIVVELTPTTVPEPASDVMLMAGFLGLAVWIRRGRK